MLLAHCRRVYSTIFWTFYFAFYVAGCSAPVTTTTPQQQNVANVVAAQTALIAIQKTIMVCYASPPCNKAAPHDKIRAAYDTAADAAIVAQQTADAGGTPNLTALASATAVLNGLVAQLKTTP